MRKLPLLKLIIGLTFINFFVSKVDAEVVYVESEFGDKGRSVVDHPIRDAYPFIPQQIENAVGDGYIFATNSRNLSGNEDIFVCKIKPDGGKDTSFGTLNGCTQIGGSANEIFSSFIVTRSNKYLLIGTSNQNIFLAMLTSSGYLDTSFGSGGILTIGTSAQQFGHAVIEAETNKYIIVGSTRHGSVGGTKDVFVTKIDESGAIDSSFGTSGELMFGGFQDDDMLTVAKGGDGNFLLAGSSGGLNQDRHFYLAKITTSGSLVSSFGTGGIVTIDLVSNEFGTKLLFLSDDNFLLQGTGDVGGAKYSYLLKLNSSGNLISSFGTGGYISFPSNVTIDDVTLDSAGKIIAVGSITNGGVSQLIVYRYNLNGLADTAFRNGSNNITLANFTGGGRNIYGNAAIVDNVRRSIIVASSFVNLNGTTDTALIKFQNGFQISGLNSSLDVQTDLKSIKSGSSYGLLGTKSFDISKNGIKMLKGTLTLTSDVSWSKLYADVSLHNNKMLFRSNDISGYNRASDLYLVKGNDHNFVVICPFATSFSDIKKGCSGEQIFHKNSRSISTFIYGGKTYWEIPIDLKNIGAMSYYEDDSTKPVTITQMHKFTDLSSWHEIDFFSTSRLIYVKGTAEPNVVITFSSPDQKFVSSTDSNGVFEVILEIKSKETNVNFEYYATSELSVNSPFKTISIHIGCNNFPDDLYQLYCKKPGDPDKYDKDTYISIIRQGNQKDAEYKVLEEEVQEVENDPLYSDYVRENRTFERITTMTQVLELFSSNGSPYINQEVWVEGVQYVTDNNGRFELDVEKDTETVLLRLADGSTVNVEFGDASLTRVYINNGVENIGLIIVLIVVPAIIISLAIVIFSSIRKKRKILKNGDSDKNSTTDSIEKS